MDKQAWRLAIRARRQGQNQAALVRWSQEIAAHVVAWPEFQAATTLLAFWPLPGEVDLRPILATAFAADKVVALPRIVRWNGTGPAPTSGPLYGSGTRWLALHRYSGDPGDLRPGPLGILEPATDAPFVRARELDLVLVPGVAFDRQGNRLGHGAGYYDRLLARVPRPVRLIGLGFGFQLVDTLPHDPHDHPLDAVASEGGIVTFAR